MQDPHQRPGSGAAGLAQWCESEPPLLTGTLALSPGTARPPRLLAVSATQLVSAFRMRITDQLLASYAHSGLVTV